MRAGSRSSRAEPAHFLSCIIPQAVCSLCKQAFPPRAPAAAVRRGRCPPVPVLPGPRILGRWARALARTAPRRPRTARPRPLPARRGVGGTRGRRGAREDGDGAGLPAPHHHPTTPPPHPRAWPWSQSPRRAPPGVVVPGLGWPGGPKGWEGGPKSESCSTFYSAFFASARMEELDAQGRFSGCWGVPGQELLSGWVGV